MATNIPKEENVREKGNVEVTNKDELSNSVSKLGKENERSDKENKETTSKKDPVQNKIGKDATKEIQKNITKNAENKEAIEKTEVEKESQNNDSKNATVEMNYDDEATMAYDPDEYDYNPSSHEHQISDRSSEEENPSPKETSKKEKRNTKRPRMFKQWSDNDTREYRRGYPGKKDKQNMQDNYRFYFNKIKSEPSGDYIDQIHKKWFGDYDLLESHHGYIQWLFPIRERGMNFYSQELQLHEAEKIKKDGTAKERVLKSYEMMLDFYGMCLVDPRSGELDRSERYKERYRNLNRSGHNYLRITRILKSLGELGYEYLKPKFVEFVMREAFENKVLPNCRNSCMDYWVHVLRDDSERKRLLEYVEEHYDSS